MMLGEDVDETDVKAPPMKRVPWAVESVDEIVELDQHKELTFPPALVLPSNWELPSDDLTKTESPSDERDGVDEDDAEGENQSSPEKDPPSPTLPMREKST